MKAFNVLAALSIAVSPLFLSPTVHADTPTCQASVVDATIDSVLDTPSITLATEAARSATGMDVYVRSVQSIPQSGVASWWEDMYRSCSSWTDSHGTNPSPTILVIGFDVDSKSSILGHGELPSELSMTLNRIHSDKLDAGMREGNFNEAVDHTLSSLSELGDIAPKATQTSTSPSTSDDRKFNPHVLIFAGAAVLISLVVGAITIILPARRDKKRKRSEAESDTMTRVRASARKGSVKPTVTIPQRTVSIKDIEDVEDTDPIPSTDIVSRVPVDDHIMFALTRDAVTLMDEIRFVGRYMEDASRRGLIVDGRKPQLSRLVKRYNEAGHQFRKDPLFVRRELDSMMEDVETLKRDIVTDLIGTRSLPGSIPTLQTRQAAVEAGIRRALNSAPRAIESGRHAMSESTGRHSL